MKPLFIVLAVIFLGGLGYLGYKRLWKYPEPLVVEIPTMSDPAVNTVSKKIAFSELVKQGGSYECTVKQVVSNTESDGVVFMDKNRLHGEFSTIVGGVKVDTTMIMKDDYTYTWSSVMPKSGFMIKVEANEGDINTATSGTYSWNAERIGDYYCKAWTVDESKFSLPAGITFVEIKN